MDVPRHCAYCGAGLSDYAVEGVCGNCLIKPALEPAMESLCPTDATTRFPVSRAGGDCSSDPENAARLGDYELLEEIARGGMGVVYRARQVSLDRIVAVKMLLAGPLAGRDFVQRFRTEAAAAASLVHPNIVAIHEVGFAQGQHFFAMDYVEGPTLAQLVAKGPLPARKAATCLKTIAEAIHFAHERKVLHRDLKPSNVLIDAATDQPRVTDFGLAKRLEGVTELTLSGQLLGSPNYVSPEQATAKRGTVGRRSDVYSLGAILYHVLTGRPPFQGETLTDVLRQLADDEPLAPRLLAPGVPRDLETICLKCLEKEPLRRYQTAQELGAELDRFLRDEPILARPVTPVEHAWRWCRRKPALAASLATAALLLLVVGVGSPIAVFRITRERQRADQDRYISDMSLVQHALDDGDIGYALRRLQAHLPRPDETDRRGFEWYYFWNLCRGDQRLTLTGHAHAVTCVAFSPDGRRLATGSAGDPVRIWDTATGDLVMPLPEPEVVSLAFTPDGRMLGVGGRDQAVIWNLETRHAAFRRKEVSGRFRLAFLPQGTLMVVGKGGVSIQGDGGSAELWDYGTGQLKRSFPESGGHIALSAGGDRLATANWEGATVIWDLPSGRRIRSLDTGMATALALTPDGRTLATSDYWSPKTKLWDVSTGQPIGWLTNYQQKVWTLALSPKGGFLITGGADNTLRLWDIATLSQIEMRIHTGEIRSAAVSADGLTLASGGNDKTAMLWDVHPGRTPATVSNVISRPIFSPNSRFVAAGVGHDMVALWDVATLQTRKEFKGADDVVGFSFDGTALLTRGTNYFLRAFDVATQTILETVPGPPVAELYSHAALSADRKVLVIASRNGTLTLYDAKTGAVRATSRDTNFIVHLALSPDGKLLATACGQTNAKAGGPAAMIWKVPTLERVAALTGHTGMGLSVEFSPDGRTLATCALDDSVKFWDATTWKEQLPSLERKEYVSSLAFSPDGKTLATACSDFTMNFWDAATRRELASLKSGFYGFHLAFSPDGQALLAWNPWDGDGAGSLRLWRAPVTGAKRP